MARRSTLINIDPDDLIYPYFVVSGNKVRARINNFPGIYRLSIDELLKDIRSLELLGLTKVLIFGMPDKKDLLGTGAYSEDSIVASAVRKIKENFPRLIVMTDVCLCAYTTHGHCGILKGPGIELDNQKTLKALASIALSHAGAGADWVAPSAMAKGQVSAIRKTLDKNGFRKTRILGYSAKFASNFYGPFRNAAGSSPKVGDRTGYQLNYRDANAALNEIAADIKEEADMVMIKPALAYLDIIKQAKHKFSHPLAAYNVSGEYAMVKAYVGSRGQGLGAGEEKNIVLEILTGIKRAGADYIISYHAKDVARWLKE